MLAYHGVDEPDSLARQMRHIRECYEPVSAAEVVAAFRDKVALPDYAVWVTFDDGLASVVESGLPILKEYGIRATLFVCPGVIETGQPFWWDLVATAVDHGISVPATSGKASQSPIVALKSVDDATRRQAVDEIAKSLEARAIAPPSAQLTVADLERWQASGNDVGNHTWDHPCLDRCNRDTQLEQIAAADHWLRKHVEQETRVFAYPNGDWTEDSEHVLKDLGYALALLFDHRLASTKQHPHRISRLRVSTTATDLRFAAIVSGVHSAAYHVRRRMWPRYPLDTALRTSPTQVSPVSVEGTAKRPRSKGFA